MKKITLFIIMFLTWTAFSLGMKDGGLFIDEWSLFAGILASLAAAMIFGQTFTENPKKFYQPERYFWFIVFLVVFAGWAFVGAMEVVYSVFHPKLPIKPGIVKIKTGLRSNSGITVLCNSITLTPGTLCVDLTDDGYIYVHWGNVKTQDPEKAKKLIVHGLEEILKKVFE